MLMETWMIYILYSEDDDEDDEVCIYVIFTKRRIIQNAYDVYNTTRGFEWFNVGHLFVGK